jgi:hypothetical protein
MLRSFRAQALSRARYSLHKKRLDGYILISMQASLTKKSCCRQVSKLRFFRKKNVSAENYSKMSTSQPIATCAPHHFGPFFVVYTSPTCDQNWGSSAFLASRKINAVFIHIYYLNRVRKMTSFNFNLDDKPIIDVIIIIDTLSL